MMLSIRLIAGKYKGIKLCSLESDLLRPTTGKLRETLFNICQNEIVGATFLDLFAGMGAIGLEALSRGAHTAIFVEKERRHADIIRKNIALCHAEESAQLLVQDVFIALDHFIKKGFSFDLIFADPPYGTEQNSVSNQVLAKIDGSSLLKKGGRLFLEDHKVASDCSIPLSHLRPQKTRIVGKTYLREFINS